MCVCSLKGQLARAIEFCRRKREEQTCIAIEGSWAIKEGLLMLREEQTCIAIEKGLLMLRILPTISLNSRTVQQLRIRVQ